LSNTTLLYSSIRKLSRLHLYRNKYAILVIYGMWGLVLADRLPPRGGHRKNPGTATDVLAALSSTHPESPRQKTPFTAHSSEVSNQNFNQVEQSTSFFLTSVCRYRLSSRRPSWQPQHLGCRNPPCHRHHTELSKEHRTRLQSPPSNLR